MFRLETDRLVIRPWNPDDRPAFTALTRDPEVMHSVHGGLPYTEAEGDEWFARQGRQLAEHDLCHRSPEIVVGLFFRERAR